MFNVKVLHRDKEIEIKAKEGQNLLTLFLSENIVVDNPCKGNGSCGKCKVYIEGEERLSCQVSVEEDLAVVLPDQAEGLFSGEESDRESVVLTEGYLPDWAKISQSELDETVACRYGDLDGDEEILGAAIDLGTTTVVTVIYDLRTGREMGRCSDINPEKIFGLDVLTRITYEIREGEKAIAELRDCICQYFNEAIGKLCDRSHVCRVTVSGNTTMLHMLLGVSAVSLGKAPYSPVFTEAKEVLASSLGMELAKGAIVHTLPSVSAYIGADIVSGTYVCDLKRDSRNIFFIDIGTNGEMVLSKGGKLISCSCAAGPALEGMNISSGMRAEKGAIEDVFIIDGEVMVKTIGDAEAKGICGSGILAAVKEGLKAGLIKKSGALREKGADIKLSEGIYLTQKDIRQVQLAKGALLSGFTALLDEVGICAEELDIVYIAGQFGAHLPEESLIGAGILPASVAGKIKYVGNSSLTGAVLALLSMYKSSEINEIARDIDYLELSTMHNYEYLLADCMRFVENNSTFYGQNANTPKQLDNI